MLRHSSQVPPADALGDVLGLPEAMSALGDVPDHAEHGKADQWGRFCLRFSLKSLDV